MSAPPGCVSIPNRGRLRSSENITSVFPAEIERWLDAGHGSCVLRRIECARIVDEALAPFRCGAACAHLIGRYAQSCPRSVCSTSRTFRWRRFASELEDIHGAVDQSIARTFREFVAAGLFSIVLFGTSSTSPTACATFGEIRRRRGQPLANPSYMRVIWQSRSTNKERRLPSRWLKNDGWEAVTP